MNFMMTVAEKLGSNGTPRKQNDEPALNEISGVPLNSNIQLARLENRPRRESSNITLSRN